MLEIPEAYVISEQLREEIVGAKVVSVIANTSPHKLTWYYENPDAYESRLVGHVVTNVKPLMGQVQIELNDMRIALSDGVNIRIFSSAINCLVNISCSYHLIMGKQLFFRCKCMVASWLLNLVRIKIHTTWLQCKNLPH